MSKSLEETKAAHAVQVEAILKTLKPGLTPGQVAEIQKQVASQIGDWQIAPLLRSLNEMMVEGLILQHPELTRPVPTRADAQALLEQKWLSDFEATFIPASEQINIKRRIDKMSDDELLALVPANFSAAESALSETDLLEARTAQPKMLTVAEQEKVDDAWLLRNFGPSYGPHLIDPRKRAELLAKRDENSNRSLVADAQRVDGYAVRFGADASDDKLSGAEMVARERAKRAVARAK